jgi:hypothetical protein
MSYPRYKIVFPRKKRNPMSELEYTESNHPVLQGYRDRVAELEAKLDKANSLDAERIQRIVELRDANNAYKTKVETVLIEAWEDYDHDTIKYIAEELDVSLTQKKQFEVNVTFTIDVECDVDETIDPDWDFEFSVDNHYVVDYRSDTIWSKES